MKAPDPHNSGSHGANKWRVVLILCLVTLALAVLLKPTEELAASPNDFAFYWTAARLVLDGRNPYSPRDTVDLQNRLSFAGKGSLVMLNPPWVLPIIVPFGLFSFSAGKALWFLVGLALVFISVHWLWDLYSPGQNRWIGWLVTVTFLPVGVVLAIGQIGPLVLFGLAGFLRFETKHDDGLAGAFLFLSALKPHLVFLIWIALLLWAVYQRRWRLPAALLATLAGASLLAIFLDHRAFQQYIGLFAEHRIALQESPTLGGLLSHVSGFPAAQFLPLAIAALWFVGYWIRWRSTWEWRERLPSLLLASMVATSYGWFFDQVVLLPSLFWATVLVLRSQRRIWPGSMIAYLTMNCLTLLLILGHRPALYYSWTALGWLILAVVVQRSATPRLLS